MDTFGSSKLKGTLSGDLWTGLGSGRMIQTLIIRVDEFKKKHVLHRQNFIFISLTKFETPVPIRTL